jgi:hypothetical protein
MQDLAAGPPSSCDASVTVARDVAGAVWVEDNRLDDAVGLDRRDEGVSEVEVVAWLMRVVTNLIQRYVLHRTSYWSILPI